MFTKFRYWIPLAIIITVLCGLIYATNQQNYRQSANDPQIQQAQDLKSYLEKNSSDDSFLDSYTPKVDLFSSLLNFLIIYDAQGKPKSSNAILNGQIPIPPMGVFENAKSKGENRLTWEPKPGVRIASVVTQYKTATSSGYILAGRSLREVEKREEMLSVQILLAWIVTLTVSFLAVMIFVPAPRRK